MVVPLSIAYNTKQEFQELRKFMWNSKGNWQLAHFDRTPDSLFGDDVKTRNTIVFFEREYQKESAVYTTNLMRWNSRKRSSLFEGIQCSKVPQNFAYMAIPKFSGSIGEQLLQQISTKPFYSLGDSITRVTEPVAEHEEFIRNAGTAYNWLPFERVAIANDNIVSHSGSKYRYWRAQTPDDAVAVFAVVHSRVAYWLWRVHGDGFHLTDRFIKNLPLSPCNFANSTREQLAILGQKLWIDMQKQRRVGRNAAVSTITYSPHHSQDLINQIDGLVVQELGLPEETCTYLSKFVRETVIAGREEELGTDMVLRNVLRGND
jgi:hypothetical protein